MILRVYAMARPRLPLAERAAVEAVAGEAGSARCRGRRVARRVVAYLERHEGVDPDEPDAIGRRLAAALSPSPLDTLALDPSAESARLLRASRLARFEARGCRQLPALAWAAETQAIMREVEAALARRYARLLTQKN